MADGNDCYFKTSFANDWNRKHFQLQKVWKESFALKPRFLARECPQNEKYNNMVTV